MHYVFKTSRQGWRELNSQSEILPLAEKVERIANLKDSAQEVEPSHQLIDKAVQQHDENSVRYLELGSCASREQEILAEKAGTSLIFDESGKIKRSRSFQIATCQVPYA